MMSGVGFGAVAGRSNSKVRADAAKLRRVSLLVNLQLRQMYGDLNDAMAGRGREGRYKCAGDMGRWREKLRSELSPPFLIRDSAFLVIFYHFYALDANLPSTYTSYGVFPRIFSVFPSDTDYICLLLGIYLGQPLSLVQVGHFLFPKRNYSHFLAYYWRGKSF